MAKPKLTIMTRIDCPDCEWWIELRGRDLGEDVQYLYERYAIHEQQCQAKPKIRRKK